MPRIADYSIISDGSFTLEVGRDVDRDFSFTLPNEAHLGSPSILAFRLSNNANNGSDSFRVEVNGSNQLSFTFGESHQATTIHTVVNANVLRHGNNNIDFVVTNGATTFSDVVLWWQHDV